MCPGLFYTLLVEHGFHIFTRRVSPLVLPYPLQHPCQVSSLVLTVGIPFSHQHPAWVIASKLFSWAMNLWSFLVLLFLSYSHPHGMLWSSLLLLFLSYSHPMGCCGLLFCYCFLPIHTPMWFCGLPLFYCYDSYPNFFFFNLQGLFSPNTNSTMGQPFMYLKTNLSVHSPFCMIWSSSMTFPRPYCG